MMKRFILTANVFVIAALLHMSVNIANAGVTRYANSVVLNGNPPFTCAEMDYGWCSATVAFNERYWKWTWTKTSSDNDVRGAQLYSKNLCGCEDPETIDIDVTIGAANSYTYSASTSWTVGSQLEWSIVKDVFGVGANASYTDSNSESWSNSQFTQVDIPVTCATPAGKRYRHYMLWDVHTDTYTGPEHVYCYRWGSPNCGDFTGSKNKGNKTGVHKERSLYGDSDAVDLGCP